MEAGLNCGGQAPHRGVITMLELEGINGSEKEIHFFCTVLGYRARRGMLGALKCSL